MNIAVLVCKFSIIAHRIVINKILINYTVWVMDAAGTCKPAESHSDGEEKRIPVAVTPGKGMAGP